MSDDSNRTPDVKPIQYLPTAVLRDPDENPNVMPEDKYRLLVEVIRRTGFLQPPLVRVSDETPDGAPEPEAPSYTIVDGYHRVKAARELGIPELPCVVVDADYDHAKALQIGMNRLRGELDLSAVGEVLTDLRAEGWSIDDLTMTGFSVDEVDDLLKTTLSRADDDVLNDAGALPSAEPDEPAPKPFVLELTFATKDELAKAKRGLRKAAGKGNKDMAQGLLRLIDGA